MLDGDADGMTDEWETRYGLDPRSDSGESGAAGDPDGDAVVNADEYASSTDPTLPNVQTLAEGATGSFFDEYMALANPGEIPARFTVTFLQPVAAPIEQSYEIAPKQDLTGRAFSTTVASTLPIIVDRAMYFSTPGRPYAGGHASAAVGEPGERFGMLVDSSAPIAVERAMYWNGGGQFWGAGTNETATRLR